MTILEKIITVAVIFFFIFLVMSLKYQSVVEIYDCSQLHKHQTIPEHN
jgi:hypothetical protein